MKVAVQTTSEHAEIPSTAILKLYDRRYLEDRGPNSRDLTAIWNHEAESKAKEIARLKSTEPTSLDTADELEVQNGPIDFDNVDAGMGSEFDCDSYEESMSETELAYQLASEDAPIDQWLIEERFRHRTRDWFNNETQAYARLQQLQQECIPRFLGSVVFDEQHLTQMPPGIQLEVHGILIEFIDGIRVDKLSTSSLGQFTHLNLRLDAVGCFDRFNSLGVIHGDIRLANLLLRFSDCRVFIIDFAHAKFRKPEQSDEDWSKRVTYEREASAIGDFIEKLLRRIV